MFGRPRRRQEAALAVAHPTGAGEDEADDGLRAILEQIAEVEAIAVAIYARHGLPDRLGHYRRRRGEDDWALIGEHLTPTEKWDMISGPSDEGEWRFATLAGLGARSDNAEVRRAAAILAACQGLRARLNERAPISAQDLADAMRLGAACGRTTASGDASIKGPTPLCFLPPSDI